MPKSLEDVIAALERRIRILENTDRLTNASIRDGSLTVLDEDGEVTVRIGRLSEPGASLPRYGVRAYDVGNGGAPAWGAGSDGYHPGTRVKHGDPITLAGRWLRCGTGSWATRDVGFAGGDVEMTYYRRALGSSEPTAVYDADGVPVAAFETAESFGFATPFHTEVVAVPAGSGPYYIDATRVFHPTGHLAPEVIGAPFQVGPFSTSPVLTWDRPGSGGALGATPVGSRWRVWTAVTWPAGVTGIVTKEMDTVSWMPL